MLEYLKEQIDWDKDLPMRYRNIELYTRVYDGTIYNHLRNHYFQERNGQEYIPLHKRKPSVKTALCKIVTDNSVSLLFGGDHFPAFNAAVNSTNDETTKKHCEDIIKEYNLRKLMVRAATIGATGSVVIFVRAIDGVLRVEAKNTKYLTPTFDAVYPDKLVRLVERYKVKGEVLLAQGYAASIIEEKTSDYWFHREWNALEEVCYFPYLVTEDEDFTPRVNKKLCTQHGLGFVPAIWIRNLPRIIDSDENGEVVDGACTYAPAIDTNIEMDYQLSQLGRALKYSADPLLVLQIADDLGIITDNETTTGANGEKQLVKGNTLTIGEKDKAMLLEISGEACRAVLDYVRMLRELMLESIHGNRANADKVNAAQSGKAMQAMNQALIWLTDNLRISYGDGGLLVLMQMIIEISNISGGIIVDGQKVTNINPNAQLSLNWPSWYPDTPSDLVQEASAIKILTEAGALGTVSATKSIASNYNIEDVDAEAKQIDTDQQKFADLAPKASIVKSV